MCHAVFHLDSGVGGVGDGDGVVLADGWLVGDDLHLHGRRCRQRTHARVVRRPDGHLEERWAVGIITGLFSEHITLASEIFFKQEWSQGLTVFIIIFLI